MKKLVKANTGISIHALLAESDCYSLRHSAPRWNFYPRSPCGERLIGPLMFKAQPHFYPRSPCGERRVTVLGIQHRAGISIHALLAESDNARPGIRQRGAISIHALLAESDSVSSVIDNVIDHFYPRSPCGERQHLLMIYDTTKKHFYPRSPCGERPADPGIPERLCGISIHALLAESDTNRGYGWHSTDISIHALLAESDGRIFVDGVVFHGFLSTLSLRRAT